jgi:hypothetical protein
MAIEYRVSAKLMIMGNIISAQLMGKNNRDLVLKTLFSFAIC